MTDHTDKHNHTTHFTNKYNLRNTPYDLRESTLEATMASERHDLQSAHQHHAGHHAHPGQKEAGDTAHTQQHAGGSSGQGRHHHMTKAEEKLPSVQLATGNEVNLEHPVDPHHDA